MAQNFLSDIQLGDSIYIRLGDRTFGDLNLYHNGTNSFIDNHTGNVYIRNFSDDKNIHLQSDDGSGGMTDYIVVHGSENIVKFQEHTRHLDNKEARFGTGSDLKIYHNGTHSYIDGTTTGDLYVRSTNDDVVIQGADDVFIYTQGGEDAIIARGDGAVELYYNNSKKLETTSAGINVTGSVTLDTVASIQGTDTGNPQASTDELRVSGYGIMGRRGTVYLTNSDPNGSVQVGVSGSHNSNPKLVINANNSLFYTNVRASTDSTYNLGSDAVRWANVYADNYYGDGSNLTGVAADESRTIILTVKNKSGGSLSKGTLVHASPSATPPSGNVIEVVAAENDVEASMPALGVLNETLADEAEGECVVLGSISGISTTDDGTSSGTLFSIGDFLYVSDTAGLFTNVKPTGTKLIQKIGIVIKAHATNGTVEVFGAGRTNDVPTPLYIDHANQRVGIGATSPAYQLHVENTSANASIVARATANTNSAYLVTWNNHSDSGNNMQIRSYGQGESGTVLGNSISKANYIWSNSDSKMVIGTLGSTDLIFGTNNNDRMRVTSGGSLLVGTTSGQSGMKFQVDGVSYFQGENTTNGTAVFVADSNKGTNQSHIHYGTTGDWYIRPSSNSGKVIIADSATTQQVGIGTPSPVSKFETKDGDVRVTTLNSFSKFKAGRASIPSAGGFNLGGLHFEAYSTGTTYTTGSAIESYADGSAWTSTSTPSYLSFQTVASSSTSLTERMRIASDGTVTLNAYGAGYLKTDANGVVSVDSSTIEDTLQTVTDRGASTDNAITISTSTNRTLTLDYTSGTGNYSLMSFKQSGTEQFRLWGSYTDNYLSFYNDQASVHQLKLNSDGSTTFEGKVGIGSAPSTRGLEVSGAGALGTILASDGTVNTVLWGDASGSNHGGVGTDNNYGFNIYQNGGVAIEIDTSKNATFAGDVTVTGGDITLGTDSIASNINAVGDVLVFKVDSNENTGGSPNMQFKIGADTELTLNGSTATFTGDISIPVAKQLFFGGGSHTYISEDVDDRLRFFCGGDEHIRFTDGGNGDRTDFYRPSFFAQDVTISGDLIVTGNTTSVNVEDLNVEQGEITLNYAASSDTSSSANGAGIRIQDAVDASNDATMLWDQTNAEFDFSHGATLGGSLTIPTGSYDEIVFTGTGGTKILAPVEMYLQAANDIYLMSHSSVNLTLGNNTATFAGNLTVQGATTRLENNVTVGNSSSDYLETRYNDTANYATRLMWKGLQLGNNGVNKIIAGRTGANGYFDFYVNNTNDGLSGTPDGDLALTIAANKNATFSGQLIIESAYPTILLTDTNNNDDWGIYNNNGKFLVYNQTDAVSSFQIDQSNNATFAGDIELDENLTFTTNNYVDIANTGTGAMRFKPSSSTLALTLAGANATFEGNIITSGNILLNENRIIARNTSDGSDSGYIAVVGGGAESDGRGAIIRYYGNEHASDAGRLAISSGNVSGAYIDFRVAGNERMRIASDGAIQTNADNGTPLQLTGIANGGQELRMRQSRGTVASPTNSSTNGDGNYLTSYVYANSAYASIGHIGIITGSATNDGEIQFSTASGGTVSERARITSTGEFKGPILYEMKNNAGDQSNATSPRIYSPSGGTFGLSAGGAERLTINSTGATFAGTVTSTGPTTIKSIAGSGQESVLNFSSTNVSGFGSTYAIDSKIRSITADSSNAYASELQFFTSDTSDNVTLALTLDESQNATFAGQVETKNNAGIYSFSDTVNAGSSEDIFKLDNSHGAQAFRVTFVCNTSGFSVAKTFEVVHQFAGTPVFAKVVDTGAYSNNDFTVAFANDSDTGVKCTITNSGATINADIVTTVFLGGSPTDITVTEL